MQRPYLHLPLPCIATDTDTDTDAHVYLPYAHGMCRTIPFLFTPLRSFIRLVRSCRDCLDKNKGHTEGTGVGTHAHWKWRNCVVSTPTVSVRCRSSQGLVSGVYGRLQWRRIVRGGVDYGVWTGWGGVKAVRDPDQNADET